MERQTEFNYSEISRNVQLRELVIPPAKGVSSATAKSVLLSIVGYARKSGVCFATQETIAKEINAGLRTVKRAIAHLSNENGLQLITRDRETSGRFRLNHYSINWGEIGLLVARARAGEFQKPPKTTPAATMADPARCATPASSSAGVVPGDPFAAIAAELLAAGLDSAPKVVRDAQASGITAEQLGEIVETFRSNQHKLKSPGAIAFRIANGYWPARGVKSRAERDLARLEEFRKRVRGMFARGGDPATIFDKAVASGNFSREWILGAWPADLPAISNQAGALCSAS